MFSKADHGHGWALRPACRPSAGGGHVARCTALGCALLSHGPVSAIVEDGGDVWTERFRVAGITTLQETELGRARFAGVVLDDYDLKANNVTGWRARSSGPVVQIDDLGMPLPGIDLVINATPGLSGDYLCGTPALLGGAYAMLAPPYVGPPAPQISTRVNRIVVSIGWSDPYGVTERVLAAIALLRESPAFVDVILGSVSPNITRVEALVNARPNWRLHRDESQPWRLIEGADLAISGAGQSLLERLAFGIPTLTISMADNQRSLLAGVIDCGAAWSLGDIHALSEDNIAAALTEVAGSVERRRSMSAAAQRLIDGRGAVRVAQHLADLAGSRLQSQQIASTPQ
jgi:UDP-2,4-diacetamido-2,4,6-trideoxy-beta-L-altropyranose hydrolase